MFISPISILINYIGFDLILNLSTNLNVIIDQKNSKITGYGLTVLRDVYGKAAVKIG